MANTAISVTELGFDKIRESLKTYIASKPEFLDYNFEGSAISLLLDLLAYNTYQQAFYITMATNESFLDSAQLRDSVVSKAKALGYTPRSARGASTTLNVTVNPTGSPTEVTIAKNTEFTASVDGQTYKFVTPQAYVLTDDDSYSGTITVVEGRPVTHRFTVSSSAPVRYLLPNKNVDTTSITVSVQTSSSDTTTEVFTLANDILSVSSTSPVFFIQEAEDEQCELFFGDGVLGKALSNGNIVIVSYRVCNGTAGNDISTFTSPNTLGGFNSFTVTVNGSTSGGANLETIKSIKFNAPKMFETQNRAVLANDYERIVRANFGDIQTINVWGGEDNNPPVYGKVFIAAKPNSGLVLPQSKKDEIKTFLKKHNVMSIDTEFIDPSYIFIVPNIKVNWDSRKTTLTANEVRNKVILAIQAYENSNLGKFESPMFRFSQFVRTIDNADSSIMSNETTLKLEKRFTPSFGVSTKYTINFGNPFENITKGFSSLQGIPRNHPGGGVVLSSTSFTYSGRTCYLDDDGFGNVRLYYLVSGSVKTFLNRHQGTIDYDSGIIVLDSFEPTAASGNVIKLFAVPSENDVTSRLNQLMLFGTYTITMYDEGIGTNTPATTVTTSGGAIIINDNAIGTLV